MGSGEASENKGVDLLYRIFAAKKRHPGTTGRHRLRGAA